MRRVWRRLVVLAFSVLLLTGLSPASSPASVGHSAPALVATRTIEWARAHGRHLRVDDGRSASAHDARAAFPPPHLLASARGPFVAGAVELERAPLAPVPRSALAPLTLLCIRVRGPPALPLSA